MRRTCPEFEIALPTGMRPSEQYGLEWPRVDLARNFVSLPKTKTGKARHIRLSVVAVAAFKVLQQRSLNREGRFFVNIQGQPLRGYKDWFDQAVEESGLRNLVWYCFAIYLRASAAGSEATDAAESIVVH
jgi:integrase